LYKFTFREWSNFTEGCDSRIYEEMAVVRYQTALLLQPHTQRTISVKELWPFAWEEKESNKRSKEIDTELYNQIKEATKDW